MVCGGFACSKNALCALNVVYMVRFWRWGKLQGGKLVGLLLIGVAAWGKGLGLVSSIHIIGGVIAVGVFLLLIAVAGLVGAVNHHQVLLFFYMIILGLVFMFQFGISWSCLAINRSKQTDVINASWWVMSNKTRDELERSFDCCGLFNLTTLYQQDYAFCTAICKSQSPTCQMCGEKFLKHSDEALKILGGVGLFFSFTEILGVWLAMRFRNQKDPRANPSAFL
ncbi:tetraspanin-31 isoform X1 [Rousettus aegyptiacus]|uniref:tetraspanin-31 isoform X1 n=1 Tax=Rousettus aegyptiacus TaxID=9407 RepID=UPI000788BCA8|nr:tetraspanin-31 isoform X1 [Rousettus aegyptiacus]